MMALGGKLKLRVVTREMVGLQIGKSWTLGT